MSATRAPVAEVRTDPTTSGRPTWALAGLAASATLVLVEVRRRLHPLGYALVGDLGFVRNPALLLVGRWESIGWAAPVADRTGSPLSTACTTSGGP